MNRVHRVQNLNTGGRVGYCLDVLDLFLAKATAGREKDRVFCTALLVHQHVSLSAAMALVSTMPLDVSQQRTLRSRIRRWASI